MPETTTIEIRPYRRGWQVYESLLVKPFFLDRQQAIDYGRFRSQNRTVQLVIRDAAGSVERVEEITGPRTG